MQDIITAIEEFGVGLAVVISLALTITGFIVGHAWLSRLGDDDGSRDAEEMEKAESRRD
jgi:hypothetical protein